MSGFGDNSSADEQLRLLIERAERLEEEIKGIRDDLKDVFLEAKAVGFNPKMMRAIMKRRKMTAEDRQMFDAELETYEHALGM